MSLLLAKFSKELLFFSNFANKIHLFSKKGVLKGYFLPQNQFRGIIFPRWKSAHFCLLSTPDFMRSFHHRDFQLSARGRE